MSAAAWKPRACSAASEATPDLSHRRTSSSRRTVAWRNAGSFVADLFRELLPAEPPRRQQPREDLRLRRMREYVFTADRQLCARCCAWSFSGRGAGIVSLLQSVEAAGASIPAYSKPASLADLQVAGEIAGGSGAVAARRRPLAALGTVYRQSHSGTCAGPPTSVGFACCCWMT